MPDLVNRDPLPALTQFATRLLVLAESFFAVRVKVNEADHLGFMTLTFCAKQIEHFRSIRALIDAHQYLDTTVIARVMLEGLVLLLWSAQRPDERAYNWRTFSLVADLRTMEALKARGEPLPEGFEDELLQRLDQHARQFLRTGYSAPATGESFKVRWHIGERGEIAGIEQMMQEIGGHDLYVVYRGFCDWIHWNPAGVGVGIRRDGENIRVNWGDPGGAAPALAAGFQALFQSLKVLNSHLALGRDAELDQLAADYVRDLTAA